MKPNKNWCLYGSKSVAFVVSTLALLSLSACQDDFGGYYKQPGWVTSSSKKVLQGRNDCKNYLKLVDKTLFSKQIEGSGQYTFLVPTDEAFADFFANNPYGYKSIDDIPDDVAARMVSSWMMYNSYPCDTLANVLTGFNSWKYDGAFKHRTPSYDVLRSETLDGVDYQLYEFPYSADKFGLSNNAPTWNNYRYLPIYTSRFNHNSSITDDDWQKVVGSPLSPYGNYLQAEIIDAGSGAANAGDLFCQNGVIHLVNKVVLPLENMDALIRTYGDGSAVDQPANAKQGAWKLLRQMLYHKAGNGSYSFFSLMENNAAAHYFEKAYPELDMSNFRLRRYNVDNTPFCLNIEEYYNMQNLYASTSDCKYDNFNGGMTFYVPEKKVLIDYINNRLFKYIGVQIDENTTQEEFDAAFNKLSENVIVSLWASMQTEGMIWPSQFADAVNTVGSSEFINGYQEEMKYDNCVISAGMASNGMWQITSFMPKTSAFEGIASRFLLDPAYSIEEDILTNNFRTSMYNYMLKSKLAAMDDIDLSLILWGDANMKWWDNVHYSTLLANYAHGELGNEESVAAALQWNLRSGYIEREISDPLDLEVDPLNGVYGGWAYTNNYAGEVIRYRKSGKIIDGKPEIQIQTSWNLRHDENEKAMVADFLAGNFSSVPSALQVTDPTEGSYASVIKDNSSEYINGNVYLATEHSVPLDYSIKGTFGNGLTYENTTITTLGYLRTYLIADQYSDNPKHTIFNKFFNYYLTNKDKKGNAEELNFGSGAWTIFVPTDEALQYAIDYGRLTNDVTLMIDPDQLPADPNKNDANWVDSCIYFINSYVTKSGCYPDDGLSGIYETTEAWDGVMAVNRKAPKQYLVTTNCKITDVDRADSSGKIVKAWSGLITGATVSGYVGKTEEGNKLQYTGRPYQSGAFQVIDVYNANEISNGKFDNTVVREQGQSNIMGYSCMIHSLNGFVIYKIASH